MIFDVRWTESSFKKLDCHILKEERVAKYNDGWMASTYIM
jgi:hypothetical protein